MAIVEASYHGRDGGAEPPTDPTRIPLLCQLIFFLYFNFYFIFTNFMTL